MRVTATEFRKSLFRALERALLAELESEWRKDWGDT
jgi:hypothetical protein